MNQDLVGHWSLSNLIEGLDNDGVLREHLQVGDLQLMLVSLLLHELHGLKEVGLVLAVGSLLVADIVT